MRARPISLALALALALTGCASAHRPGAPGPAVTPADEVAAREAELARATAELERLELGVAAGATRAGCDRAAELVDNICALAERICAAAARAPELPSGPVRCGDARARCRAARDRIARAPCTPER
jgi:hypothetical protein